MSWVRVPNRELREGDVICLCVPIESVEATTDGIAVHAFDYTADAHELFDPDGTQRVWRPAPPELSESR